jgi:hypothetical protein
MQIHEPLKEEAVMKRFILFSILISLLMFITFNAELSAREPVFEPEGEIVFKSYDLSGFTPSIKGHDDETKFSLIPFHPMVEEAKDKIPEALEGLNISPDRIRDLVMDFVGQEVFEHESVGIDLISDRLLVKAPAAIQAQVKAVIHFLEAWWNRKVVLDLEVFAEKGPDIPDGYDVQALQESSEKNGGIRFILKRTLECRLGECVQITDGVQVPVLWDHESEIAQSSLISEPQISSAFEGVKITARSLLAADGETLIIGICGMLSRFMEPMQSRETGTRGRLGSDQVIKEVTLLQALDDPKIGFAGLAAKVAAVPGAPNLIRCTFPHSMGTGSLLIKLTARPLRPLKSPVFNENQVLAAWDFNHLQSPCQMLLYFRRLPDLSMDWSDYQSIWDNTIAYLCPFKRFFYSGTEEVLETVYPELFDPSPEISHHLIGDTVFLKASPKVQQSFQGKIRQAYQSAHAKIQADLRFVAMDGPPVHTDGVKILEQGKVLGALSLTMIKGGNATAIAGLEGLMIQGYDVDVATHASIPNPNPGGYLDGMMVHLAHSSSGDPEQGGTLRAMVLLNLLKESIASQHLGEEGGLIGFIDRPVFHRGFIDTRFDLDGKLHVLGSLSCVQQNKPNTLYVIGRSQSQ